MHDTVEGSDWLSDQDAIEYMCREAVPAVLALEHYATLFSRTEDRHIYRRSLGGRAIGYGKTMSHRTCAGATRTASDVLQYSSASMTVRRRRVTIGSAESGLPAVSVAS
ncbi:hypothetical protein GCM10017653_17700 [Ancylobacter defluvii]|uniref:FAD-dependent oxidoreductase 2 FAD-binding domain-containing protein n=2 Tax=Ancylobacter defluvii TaxID=1282440 RepID=A0A9W6JTX0_9HYPH|nr:hypothetical protein GCM10017653_17700 [Ancylobacter defluvii]